MIFDKRGNLKPYQIIVSSKTEFEKIFVSQMNSVARRDNFEKYIHYSNDLKKILGKTILKQWVNGSFVSKKVNPKDIDLVSFIDHHLIVKLGKKLDPFKAPLSWTVYGVDAYLIEVYPQQHKHNKFTKLDTAEWLDLFSSTRPNRKGERFKKGFLEIIY